MGRLINLDKVEFLKVEGNIEFNHGVDCCINRLLEQPTVEAIPKDQYEARLKADMIAMLTKIYLDMQEIYSDTDTAYDNGILASMEFFEKEINALRGNENEKD